MASTHGKCQFVADNHKGCSVLGLSPWTLSLQIFISWKISSKQINKLTVPARTLSLTLITTMFTDHLTMGSQTMTRSNTETLKSTFRIFLLYLGKQGSLHQVFKRKKKKKEGKGKKFCLRDFPGGPVAKTQCSQYREPGIQSLVRELDPTCCS